MALRNFLYILAICIGMEPYNLSASCGVAVSYLYIPLSISYDVIDPVRRIPSRPWPICFTPGLVWLVLEYVSITPKTPRTWSRNVAGWRYFVHSKTSSIRDGTYVSEQVEASQRSLKVWVLSMLMPFSCRNEKWACWEFERLDWINCALPTMKNLCS